MYGTVNFCATYNTRLFKGKLENLIAQKHLLCHVHSNQVIENLRVTTYTVFNENIRKHSSSYKIWYGDVETAHIDRSFVQVPNEIRTKSVNLNWFIGIKILF